MLILLGRLPLKFPNHLSLLPGLLHFFFVPSHFVLLPCHLEWFKPAEFLDCHQFLLEIGRFKVFVRLEAKDPLLLQLSAKHLLQLSLGQLAVVVQSQGLQATILVLFELHFMLNYIYASFEDTFVLDGLSNHEFASTSSRTLRYFCLWICILLFFLHFLLFFYYNFLLVHLLLWIFLAFLLFNNLFICILFIGFLVGLGLSLSRLCA